MFSLKRPVVTMGILAGFMWSASGPLAADPKTGDHRPESGDRASARSGMLIPSEWATGSKVLGTEREKVGDINDLLVTRRNGRVAYALVGHGGVLGIGEKVIAVPYPAFGWDMDSHDFSLPVTKAQLAAAPTLEAGEWKTLSDSSRADTAFRYFNIPPERLDEITPDDARPIESRLASGDWPLLRVKEIRGNTLMSDDGRDLGKIDELVFDAGSGRVAFVVVTFGGTLGFGAEKALIPWTFFDVNKDGRLFATNLDKEKILSAPRLTSNNWSDLRDRTLGARVYNHFGVSAPWILRTTEEPGALGTQGSPTMRYDRAYLSGSDKRLSGEIVAIEELRPLSGAPEVTCVKVRTADNDTVKIHLAPRWYLDQQQQRFTTGDRVTINGRLVEVDGSRYIIASEVTKASGQPFTLRRTSGEPAWTWR